jgi:hypothetical protein
MANAFIDFVLSYDFVHTSLILLGPVAAISITLIEPSSLAVTKNKPKMQNLYSFYFYFVAINEPEPK